MKKYILSFFISLFSSYVSAQESAILLRPYYGVGIANVQFNLGNDKVNYSPALGSGFELGYSIQFNTTWGYYATFSLHKPTFERTFREQTTSVTFNNKQLNIGCYYQIIDFKSSALTGYLIGFGVSTHLPGNLLLIENNKSFEAIGYEVAYSASIDGRLLFNVGAHLSIEPGFKLRYLKYTATSYGQRDNDLSLVPNQLLRLSGSGVEISCAFRYTIGKKKVK
jgi:hypothetical protein